MSSNSKELCKLFNIVFHQILYINNVYVKQAFECIKVSNLQVWKCVHPGVCQYIYKFLTVAQEHFNKCQPIQIVFELKIEPDAVIDEYVFHVHPKQFELTQSELMKNCTNILRSLKTVALDRSNSLSENEELTFALLIREEESDIHFPNFDKNSNIVFVQTSEDDCARIIPLKRTNSDKDENG